MNTPRTQQVDVQARDCVTVTCSANRGKEYRVTFNAKDGGSVVLVEAVYRRWNDTGRVYRQIWSRLSGKPMSALVACAIRAAECGAASHG